MPGLGRIRARCKADTCVVEFDRVPDAKKREAARIAQGLGFEFVAGAVDVTGETRYATEMILREKPRPRRS